MESTHSDGRKVVEGLVEKGRYVVVEDKEVVMVMKRWRDIVVEDELIEVVLVVRGC